MYFKDARVYPHGSSSELVVVLHGWGFPRDRLRDLLNTVCAEKPDADLLVPVYGAGWISRIDPLRYPDRLEQINRQRGVRRLLRRIVSRPSVWLRALICWLSPVRARDVAAELVELIDQAVTARAARPDGKAYNRIILIGHSIGALLIRKVYVFARGEVGDHPDPHLKSKPWAAKIERLVLLSCMNRGWRLERRPRHMGLITYRFFRLVSLPARAIGLAKLIFDMEWGAPFVANLRMQWMKLARYSGQHALPTTILLIGDVDDMVDVEDHKDILVAGGSCLYWKVHGTGHYDILRFDRSAPTSDTGRRKFIHAITADPAVLETDLKPYEPDTSVERVIFLRHGIRDYGHWTHTFRRRITELYGQKVVPETTTDRRLSTLRFLLRWGRGRLVREFMDLYTEAVAKYSSAHGRIGFIGHSHGTLLLDRVLEEYSEAHFDCVALAGSIIPRAYDWREKMRFGRVQRVRNDLTSSDWAVGILARLFEWIREELPVRVGEIGSSGFNGFLQNEAQTDVAQYIRGGHSAALKEPNATSLIRFVVEGISPGDYGKSHPNWETLLTNRQNGIVRFLSNNCWLVIALIVGALVGVLFEVYRLALWYGLTDWGALLSTVVVASLILLIAETA